MAKAVATPVYVKPPDEDKPFVDYGPIGDLGRYANLALSLIFNYGFALFVGYVLGEMADDSFLGVYDGIFTVIGLALGFVGAYWGAWKRILKFGLKLDEMFRSRYQRRPGLKPSRQLVAVGYCFAFAGVTRLADFIYTSELTMGGASWLLYLDLALLGIGLTLIGTLLLTGRLTYRPWMLVLLLLPLASGAGLTWFALQGGARLNVITTMTLLATTPLVGIGLGLKKTWDEEPAA